MTGSTRAVTAAWLVLLAVTVGSWWLAPAHLRGTVVASAPITALVLVLTAVKVRLIMHSFMEIDAGPAWLRRACDAWLAVLFGAVFVIYLV
ncbi:cytochrome C oxidase subunit IV family protein [uncultured Mycolicibacterium sp.]|uniref:cytochrome C oxidase subunit IV family protein n=1 Tax=uncultured Mycolicibacterium sp. TaxID=2320817 RepID=UPI00261E24B8|nr:cytochrome C oxidase subunit IV family protein [uncultured Mycolicibacterium sp.]